MKRSVLLVAWASPWTVLGLLIGAIGLPFGGKYALRSGIIEFHGGFAAWLLEHLPMNPMAMTLGHCVVGISKTALDISHAHELIHVKQYERWGFFFIPAYLLASAFAWMKGRDAYRDNPFEREAFEDG